MDKNKLWDKLQALEEKVDSLLEYEQANKRCEANEVKTEIEFKPKMKRLDLEAKLYSLPLV